MKDIDLFIEKLYEEADKLNKIADGESLHASGIYYGKAEGYREVADKLKKHFGIPTGSVCDEETNSTSEELSNGVCEEDDYTTKEGIDSKWN